MSTNGMRLSRRAVLTGLLALPAARGVLAAPGTRYMSCADDRNHRHFVVGFDAEGHIDFQLPLPARGHGFALHPASGDCVVFARRPGSFACVIDLAARAITSSIAPVSGRSFYGHGTFSADGEILYVCEHENADGTGLIGLYDVARGYARIGEFSAGGIGPHEVRLMPDGKTLVVAVGGILTDLDRDKLNIETMDPSLVYLDAASGRLLEQVRPPRDWHQLSIRHIDIDAQGHVAVAMHYEGDERDAVPLAALHRRSDALMFLRAPEDDEIRLHQYLGDIAFDASGATVAATSPRGSVVAVWDAVSGDHLALEEAADGCGIVGTDDGFVVAGGDGRLRRISAGSNRPVAATTWLLDNHLIAL
jgi:hypothetical protein